MQGEIIYNKKKKETMPPDSPDTYKFDTCKHRSEKPEEYTTRTCCQSKTETGYICRKIPINGVRAYHCKDCPVFSPKEEFKEE